MAKYPALDGFTFIPANPFRPLCCGCYFADISEPCPEIGGVKVCERTRGFQAVILQKDEK